MAQDFSEGIKKYIREGEAQTARRVECRRRMKAMRFDTVAVHGIYDLEEALAGGRGGTAEPIYASASQAYRDCDEMEASLAYLVPVWCYSRISNPTVSYLEETLSLLETYGCDQEASAYCAASGMAAIKQALEPLLALGDRPPKKRVNIVVSAPIYGGSYHFFAERMKERGVEVRWVALPWDVPSWMPNVDEETRFFYMEMPSNPQMACTDLEALAAAAHGADIPLVVDATVATPALLRPIVHGADIVVHSLTKTIGSGGTNVGGAFIARHHLPSHHLAEEAKKDYATWVKLWPARDSGPYMTPQTAFALLGELRTLRMRIDAFSRNTEKVVEFLAQHPKVERVHYLGLKQHPLHALASRYLKLVDDGRPCFGHLLSFEVRGESRAARRFLDALGLIFRATDLGRIKSLATIPAITTNLQQGEEARQVAGVPLTMVRLAVGGEHPDDLIRDLELALKAV